MKQPFAAEVLFRNPADVPHATEALREAALDFTVDPDATGDWPNRVRVGHGRDRARPGRHR
jgi:hypothetical protein